MSIISHITLGTNDTEHSRRFYDEVLGVPGFARLPKLPGKPAAYKKLGLPTIYLYAPEDGRPATWGNGTHIAFVAETKEAVHSFHEAARRLGGSCAGKPGPSPYYGDNCYATYVRDPDGNKLQAVHYATDDSSLRSGPASCLSRIGDIAELKFLRPARTAGSVGLHRGIRLLATGSNGPSKSIRQPSTQGAGNGLTGAQHCNRSISFM